MDKVYPQMGKYSNIHFFKNISNIQIEGYKTIIDRQLKYLIHDLSYFVYWSLGNLAAEAFESIDLNGKTFCKNTAITCQKK